MYVCPYVSVRTFNKFACVVVGLLSVSVVCVECVSPRSERRVFIDRVSARANVFVCLHLDLSTVLIILEEVRIRKKDNARIPF